MILCFSQDLEDFPLHKSIHNQDPTKDFKSKKIDRAGSRSQIDASTSSNFANNRPMIKSATLGLQNTSSKSMSSLQNTSSKNATPKNEKGNAKSNSTPAKVCIVHDSILNGIKPGKLGKGYGCVVEKKRAFTIAQVQASINDITSSDAKPEAVLIHVGVNDLKSTDGKTAAKRYGQVITKFAKDNPSVKVIVSKVAPTRSADVNKQRHVFNTKITIDLVDSGAKNVYAINHEHLRPYDLYDQFHPNQRGNVKLAVHIGRVLWGLFWQESSRLRRKQQQEWWAEHVMQY